MVKRLLVWLIPLSLSFTAEAAHPMARQAEGVIKRTFGPRMPELDLRIDPNQRKNFYEVNATGSRLTITGNNAVALCRGFYDYMKANELGINSWSGSRLKPLRRWPSAQISLTSPYQHHYYLNVVTYGYSTPYWDWKRWQQEIDWMALHGFDFPLALVATEAIAIRVWERLGLKPADYESFYVGPAHLPWQRMGNIVDHDGPLPAEWHKNQIALQHKILNRMRSLGMKPVAPAFGGFVPTAMKKYFPQITLHRCGWGGWPAKNHGHILMPNDPLFQRIGKMYVEEWEKEFGKMDFYLADSFNEMEIPVPKDNPAKRDQILGQFGEAVYKSINSGNPNATWVVQGWMFGYMRNIWNKDTVKALFSKVPANKVIILDLATDYNAHFWRSGFNWDVLNAFDGKQWIFSTVPNMGGKISWTGVLDFYAKGGYEALNSANRGKLVGYGTAMEGIENNEMLYELIGDMAWRKEPVNLDAWIQNYCVNRYGSCPEALIEAFQLFRKSCYSNLKDHPRYNWHFRPGRVHKGSAPSSATYLAAVEKFASCGRELARSPLYQADLSELVASYLGVKLQDTIIAAQESLANGATTEAKAQIALVDRLFMNMDRVLQTHPLHTLDRWIGFARKSSKNRSLQDYYEKNAKRLVTVWGPPIDDYAAKTWSGLIRDYYRGRWMAYFESRLKGQNFEALNWELNWVESTGLSKTPRPEHPVKTALAMLNFAKTLSTDGAVAGEQTVLGQWSPEQMKKDWTTLEYRLNTEDLKGLKGIQFNFIRGESRLEIQQVALYFDGRKVAEKKQFGYAGQPSKDHFYALKIPAGIQANNACVLKVTVRATSSTNSNGQIVAVK